MTACLSFFPIVATTDAGSIPAMRMQQQRSAHNKGGINFRARLQNVALATQQRSTAKACQRRAWANSKQHPSIEHPGNDRRVAGHSEQHLLVVARATDYADGQDTFLHKHCHGTMQLLQGSSSRLLLQEPETHGMCAPCGAAFHRSRGDQNENKF